MIRAYLVTMRNRDREYASIEVKANSAGEARRQAESEYGRPGWWAEDVRELVG